VSVGTYLRVAGEIARKDLVLELRSKRVLSTAVVFALLVVVTFAFSFAKSFTDLAAVGHGALWISFVFAGTLSVTQSGALESRDGAIDGLMLVPVDRSAIYVGKVASSTVFVAGVELLTLAFVSVFLGYTPPIGILPALIAVVALASLGFSAVGVVLSMLTAKSQVRELLLPALLIPLTVPVLLAGVELTRSLTGTGPTGQWLRLLLAYDGILLLAGLMTFEFVLEE
jgi:heme exporter protein B